MPRTIIGFDISEDIVAAVQVKSQMQGYQVTGCYAVPITEAGGVPAAIRGVCDAIDPKGSVCYSVVEDGQISFRNLSLPFAETRKIRQTIGFELETVLATPVEELMIDFIDVDRTASQTSLIAATVKRAYLEEHLAGFGALGVEPEVLDIRNISLANQILSRPDSPGNSILLNLESGRCAMLLFLEKRIVLIRHLLFDGHDLTGVAASAARGDAVEEAAGSRHEIRLADLSRAISLTLRAFQVENGMDSRPEQVLLTGPGALLESTAPILSKGLGLPVYSVNLLDTVPNIQVSEHLKLLYNPPLMDNALALALRDPRKARGFNFRREDFQVRTQFVKVRKELTQAAVFLVIILVLLGGGFMLDYRDLRNRNTEMDSRIREIFSRTFPEITNVVEPMHQMRTKVAEQREMSGAAPGVDLSGTFLDVLNDISARIPGELEIQVDRMVVDQDGIQIRGTTDTFNTVDSIKKGLESSEKYNEVTIASANLDKSGKGVRFEIKMNRTL